VVIGPFGQFSHLAHALDPIEKRWEGDRPAKRAVGALPAIQVPCCGIDFVIAE